MREARYPLLLAVAALALVLLAYQAPVTGTVSVGGPLSPAFLGSSEAQDAGVTRRGLLYADELNADGGRSRWTRQRAVVRFVGLGDPGPLALTLVAQGWPGDAIGAPEAQPRVSVSANGRPIGSFTASEHWERYRLDIPAAAGASELALRIETSSVFTATRSYPNDVRPHGIRLRSIALAPGAAAALPRVPDAGVLLGTVAAVLLCFGAGRRTLARPAAAAALALGLLLSLALSIAAARLWVVPALSLLLPLLLLAFAATFLPSLTRLFTSLRARLLHSGALAAGLLVAVVVGLGLLLARLASWLVLVAGEGVQARDPILAALVILLGYSVILGLMNLSALSSSIRRAQARLISGRWSAVLLALFLAGWLAYEWSVISALPYVGHADYADNAVVARNLLRGRGWVVDYVTQFYRLNPGGSVVRPQETWPLLQPVWILPFFAAFGPVAWAAKLPNLVFNLLLAAAIFLAGARLWDRRVGLVAALLTLTNQYFFKLTIYATSDLGFVLFSFAAIALFFFARERDDRRLLVWSGLLTGLMCLQKPSGVLLAGGMGLWWLCMLWRSASLRSGAAWRGLLLAWLLPAALILSPYLARNTLIFGQPFYSTESHDAWVLGFRGNDDEAWEDIYKIFTREGGLPGAGVPDRSWILRWGYERTYQKIERQFEAVRDYLLPPLAPLAPVAGSAGLLGLAATWLAIIGLLAGRGGKQGSARLLGLLLAAFGPYILFLCTYWHADEERYFVPLVPWLALFAGGGLVAVTDTLGGAWRGRAAVAGAVLAGLLLVLAVQQPYVSGSGWQQIEQKLEREPALWRADIAAFEWLEQHTPPNAVVMTRVPWQLTYHADRPSLMTPNTEDLETLLRLAQYYRAEYLVVNAMANEKAGARRTLAPLIAGQEAAGFARVHQVSAPQGRTIFIYRFPPNYGGVAELEMP